MQFRLELQVPQDFIDLVRRQSGLQVLTEAFLSSVRF